MRFPSVRIDKRYYLCQLHSALAGMAIARVRVVLDLSMTNGRFDGFGDILIVQNGHFCEYLPSDEPLMHQQIHIRGLVPCLACMQCRQANAGIHIMV